MPSLASVHLVLQGFAASDEVSQIVRSKVAHKVHFCSFGWKAAVVQLKNNTAAGRLQLFSTQVEQSTLPEERDHFAVQKYAESALPSPGWFEQLLHAHQ